MLRFINSLFRLLCSFLKLHKLSLLLCFIIFIGHQPTNLAQNTCASPDVINSLPFDQTGLTTCGTGDDYDSGSVCGGFYMTGEDYVFEYTAAQTGCHLFSIDNTAAWSGLFVLDGCPDDINANCIESQNNGSDGDPTLTTDLVNGTTYYIVVSTWPNPDCTAFDIYVDECITGNDCSDPYIVNSVPFSATGLSTCHVDNNYGFLSACTSSSMEGNDFVFEFTAPTTDCYIIDITNTSAYAAAFLIDGCPDSFTSICLATDVPGFAGNPTIEMELTSGQSYTLVVSTQINPNSCTDFDISINTGACPEPEPTDCINAVPVCSNSLLNFNSNGAGENDFSSSNNNNGCLGLEHQSAWFEIQIGSDPNDGGDLAFTIDPVGGSGEDYDFAIYGPDVPCNNLGNPVRCSYAGDGCFYCPETGLGNGATDTSENSGGNGFVAPLPVQPGETYYILVDNFESSSSGFNLTWTGDAILDCNILEPCTFTANGGADITICESSPDFQLNGSVTDPVSGLTYTWTANPNTATAYLNNTSTLTPTFDVSSLPNGFLGEIAYTLEVSDGTCSSFDHVIVIVGSPSTAPSATTPIEYCVNSPVGSLSSIPSNSGIINWYDVNPSTSSPTPVATGNTFTPSVGTSSSDDIDNTVVGTTSFWITETPSGECESAPFQIDVTFIAQPVLDAIADQVSCTNSFDLSTIAVTDANGLNLNSATITYYDDNSGSPGTAIGAVVSASSQYWIEVDLAGCIAATEVQVTLGEMNLTVTTEDATCGEQDGEATANPSMGTAPYTYEWSTSPTQTNSIATGLAATTYTVTVTDANSCTITAEGIVSVPDVPDAVASSNSPLCEGEDIQLTASTTSTATDISYNWSGPNNFSSTEQNPSISNTNSTFSGFYYLTITANDCPSPEVSTEVFVYDQPDAIVNEDIEVCDGADVQLTGSTTSTSSNLSYQWSGPNTFSSTEQNPLISNAQTSDSGTYTLILTADGCTSEAATTELTVNQSPDIEDSLPQENSCTGSFDLTSINITDINASSPTLSYHEDDSGMIGNTLGNTSVSDSGTYWILAENGDCSDSVSVVVNIFDAPTADFSLSATELCVGSNDEITITFTGSVTDASAAIFNWDFDGGTIITGSGIGPYTVSWTSVGTGTATISLDIEENGCFSSVATMPLTLTQNPDIDDTLPDQFSCTGSFDLTSIGITDANATSPTLSYYADNAGAIGVVLGNPNVSDSGTYWILAENGNCSDSVSVVLNIFDEPIADFTISATELCANGSDEVTITFTGSVTDETASVFNWDFDGGTVITGSGSGPYTVAWPNTGAETATISLDILENGCPSNVVTETITLQTSIPIPSIACSSTSPNSVSFDWNDITGITDYSISYTINGELPPITDTTSDSDYQVDGLAPNDVVEITVIALNSGPCGDSSAGITSCTADDCPILAPSIDILTTYCIDDPSINLTGTPTGGIFYLNATETTVFDPGSLATETAHTVEYVYTDPANDCVYSVSENVTIYPIPSANFTLSAPTICVDGTNEITVTYSGVAPPGATFNWDFGDANVTSGSEVGPYTLTWNAGNNSTQTVSLTVTQNACVSPIHTENITLSEPLATPVVDCTEINVNSIVFDWQDITGASSYDITYTINSGSSTNATAPSSTFEVTGLSPNDVVEISVVAVGSPPCGNSEAGTVECEVLHCPPINVNIINVEPQYCIDAAPFTMFATPSGGVFSGPGVTGNDLNPTSAGIGNHSLTYIYTDPENGCEHIADAFFTVHPVPSAEFELNPFQLCADGISEATITFLGSVSSPNAIFNWNFNGGTLVSGEGVGPLSVVWENANGTANVSLSITENGCTSPVETESIILKSPLAAPDVICSETTSTSVSFEWQHIDFAFGYEVTYTVNGGEPITASTLNAYFDVENLNIGDVVEISVVPVGEEPCGNGFAGTAECVVEDCPELEVNIENLSDTYCNDEGIIILEANPVGGVFSGEGVSGNEFDPTLVNSGSTSIQYTYTDPNNDCTYNTSASVTIIEVPIAEFELSSTSLCADGNMETIVTFTGTADLNAVFEWDFGGGIALPATGFGPHTVVWTNAQATGEISLSIDNQGCTSMPYSQTVDLVQPLETFEVSCGTVTTQAIDFEWEDVANAMGYEITYIVNGESAGSPMSVTESEFSINDLTTQDSVQIFVVAIATEPCANVEASVICATSDCPDISLEIGNPNAVYCANEPTVELNATPIGGIFVGDGIEGENSFNPSAAIVGENSIEYQYTDSESGCFYSLPFTIIVEAPLATPLVNCVESTQNTVTFDWELVIGADSYEVNYTVNGGEAMIETVNAPPFEVDGLSPQDEVTISVVAVGDGVCGNSEAGIANCVAQDCEALELSIDNLEDSYCEDAPAFSIEATPAGGIFRINNVEYTVPNAVFDPTALGVGNHLIEYVLTIGDCVYTTPTNVEITANPSANFTIDASSICMTDAAMATYTGSTNTTYSYNWDFDGGIAENTGQETYEVRWSSAGTKNIRLQVVSQEGCVSEEIEQTIEVTAPIETPNVNCGASTQNSVSFNWNDLGGGYDFEVTYTINGENPVTETTHDNTFEVDGLSPQDEVELTIVLLNSGICGNGDAMSQTCIAQDCEEIILSIDNLDLEYCSDAESVVLMGSPTGGIFYVNGSESTSFNPMDLGEGEHLVEYVLQQGDCPYNTSLNIEIVEPIETPNVNCGTSTQNSVSFNWNDLGGGYDFEVTYTVNGENPVTETTHDNTFEVDGLSPQDEVELTIVLLNDGICGNGDAMSQTCIAQDCEEINLSIDNLDLEYCSDTESIILEASPSGGIFYVNGSEVTSFNPMNLGEGEHLVEYVLQQGDCPYNTSLNIEIIAPIETPNVNCGASTQNSVSFNWNDLGGGYDFEVTYTVNGENPVTETTHNNTFEVDGLSPQDEVELTIVLLNSGICGNGDAMSQTCIAQDCEEINLSIDNLDLEYCSDAESVVLEASPEGGTFYVNGSESAFFNPMDLGEGEHLVEYVLQQGDCPYNTSLNIEIVEPIETPNVNCGASTQNSVSFNWSDLGGGYDFEVTYTINGENPVTETTHDHTFEVDGLSPQDEVELTIVLLNDGICGNGDAMSQTCIAQDCEEIILSIDNLDLEYCSDAESVSLVATPTGGSFYVNGNEVTSFNPMDLGEGEHLVEYVLQQGDCPYSTSLNIEIIAPIETPNVNCGASTQNSVSFNWNDLGGGYDFEVTYTVNGANPVTETTHDNTFEVDGLSPQDEVELTIVLLNSGICGNGAAMSQTCIAQDCEEIILSIDNLDLEYCSDAESVALMATPAGGTFYVNGSEVTSFNPIDLGEGSHEVEYVLQQGDCPYNTSLEVNVVEPIETPNVNCGASTQNSVSFNWNDLGGGYDFEVTYTVNGENPMTETTHDHTFEVDGLSPQDEVELTIVLLNSGICGNGDAMSQTCIAQDCEEIILSIDNLDLEYCSDAESVVLMGSPTGGIFYVNGSEVTSFNPMDLGEGEHLVEYILQQGDCPYSTSLEVNVVEPIETPNVNCGASTQNSVSFNWSDLGGGYDFEVTYTINGENPVTETTHDNTFEVDGLSPQDEVELTIVLLNSGICGNGDAVSQTCIAQDCEEIILSIDNLNLEYCSDAESVVLMGSPTGGIFYVNGSEVTSLNPMDLGEGEHLVEYVLQQGDCHYNTNLVVAVAAPLEVPVINCGESTENSVRFDWQAIEGVSDYRISYRINNQMPIELILSETSFEVSDLAEGDQVSIEVAAMGVNLCGEGAVVSQTCTASGCPELNFNLPNTACVGESIGFELMSGFGTETEYLWTISNGQLPEFSENEGYTLNIEHAGWQVLQVETVGENDCGMAIMDSIFISDISLQTIADTVVLAGTSIKLQSFVEGVYEGDLTYLWESSEASTLDCSDCANPLVSPQTPTTYSLMVIDENGCFANTSVFVDVIHDYTVIAPNAFSPNGDGVNDSFLITGAGISSIELVIYNRWGKEVFRTQDEHFVWDGTYNEENQAVGVYAYYALVRFEDGSEDVVTGNLTLIR